MEKSHSDRITEWSCNHLNDNNPGNYSLFGLPFMTGMSPTTNPTFGLLALRAAAADTGELLTVHRSAALLVDFVRQPIHNLPEHPRSFVRVHPHLHKKSTHPALKSNPATLRPQLPFAV